MLREGNKSVGELLLEQKVITEKQLKEGLKKQKESKKRLGNILVELGYVTEQELIQILEYQLGFTQVKLNNYILSKELAKYIPENLARRYQAVPLEKKGNTLKVAMVDPSDLVTIDDIEMVSGLKVNPLIASKNDINKALSQVYSLDENATDEIFADLSSVQSQDEIEIDELKKMVEDAPIVRLTNLIISQGLQQGASDIHIEPQENLVRVRYRIDGVLKDSMTAPKYSQAALVSRLKIIADLDITNRRIPQDGRIAMNVKGINIDMRVSSLPTIHGEKIVIRLLNKDEKLLSIDQLGYTKGNYKAFTELINKPHGILLVTGPTGSGKSTTLFAALNELNSAEKNIVTIEDPIEYQIEGINQVQARSKIGLTFARTLRSILRQDPDIVMVGEIRDEETASIAVRAALTGHLVLSTLHTNDSVSTITRLIDMEIAPYLVASTLIGVVAQRLVRRLCQECKEEYNPPIEEREFLKLEDDVSIYQAKGCERCNSSGYKGRLAVQEVLLLDDMIKELIVQQAGEQDILRYSRKKGMKTLMEDGIIKVKKGITTYEELIRVVV